MLNVKGYIFVSIVSLLISLVGIEILTSIFNVLVKIPLIASFVTVVIFGIVYYGLFTALTSKSDNAKKRIRK